MDDEVVSKIILTRNSLPLNPILIFIGINCKHYVYTQHMLQDSEIFVIVTVFAI